MIIDDLVKIINDPNKTYQAIENEINTASLMLSGDLDFSALKNALTNRMIRDLTSDIRDPSKSISELEERIQIIARDLIDQTPLIDAKESLEKRKTDEILSKGKSQIAQINQYDCENGKSACSMNALLALPEMIKKFSIQSITNLLQEGAKKYADLCSQLKSEVEDHLETDTVKMNLIPSLSLVDEEIHVGALSKNSEENREKYLEILRELQNSSESRGALLLIGHEYYALSISSDGKCSFFDSHGKVQIHGREGAYLTTFETMEDMADFLLLVRDFMGENEESPINHYEVIPLRISLTERDIIQSLIDFTEESGLSKRELYLALSEPRKQQYRQILGLFVDSTDEITDEIRKIVFEQMLENDPHPISPLSADEKLYFYGMGEDLFTTLVQLYEGFAVKPITDETRELYQSLPEELQNLYCEKIARIWHRAGAPMKNSSQDISGEMRQRAISEIIEQLTNG